VLGPELQFVDRDYVSYQGRRMLYLAGTDYHRMSNHPDVVKAAMEAAQTHGLSPTGSRATTGNHALHVKLERVMSEFFATDQALVSPTGYLSNTVMLQAIAHEYDVLIMDDRSHASLVDAARLCEKGIVRFLHLDSQSLADQLKKTVTGKSKPLVLTDGVFPLTGDIAPLKTYSEILSPYDGKILVDDAHAMAIIGPNGKGSWEDQGISQDRVFQTGTLSKGFGVAGGVIPATTGTIDAIHTHSLAFAGCTGLALPLAAAALASVTHLHANRHLMTNLQKRSLHLKHKFNQFGLKMPLTPTPIFPITFNDDRKNKRLRKQLIENNIYPPFIHYPGGPAQGYFRFILTSNTSNEQEDQLFEAIRASV
jgi:7-keto-8-aminopelargonate synthetase-like enzyme